MLQGLEKINKEDFRMFERINRKFGMMVNGKSEFPQYSAKINHFYYSQTFQGNLESLFFFNLNSDR